MGEIDVEGAGFGIAVIEEGDAGDGAARPADFRCCVDLLRQGVWGIGTAWKKAVTIASFRDIPEFILIFFIPILFAQFSI